MSATGSGKATGWKIPLLFCAAAILIVSVVALWRYLSRPEIPALEPGLLEQARALHIDLEADAWGRSFKNLLVDSAAGFSGHALKDAKVELLAREAMDSGRFDGACAASALVYNDYKRDGLLADMVRRAANDCADLPWGAFAAKKMNGAGVRIDAHVLLNTRWRECSGQAAGR